MCPSNPSIPGQQYPPNALPGLYNALLAAIGSGVHTVRFQDRTIQYASVTEMLLAANTLYQTMAAQGINPNRAALLK